MAEYETKSKRRIREAFLDLLSEKSFNEITVRDISSRADVGRTTFYAHYDDKFELLEEIQSELIEGFARIMLKMRDQGSESFFDGILAGKYDLHVEYFRYVRANAKAFRVLLDYRSETNFSSRFTSAISRTRNETDLYWRAKQGRSRTPEEDAAFQYRDAVLAAVYVNLFFTWLDRDMDMTEEQMGHMLSNLWQPNVMLRYFEPSD